MWRQYARVAIPPLTFLGLHLTIVSERSAFVFTVLAGAVGAHLLLALLGRTRGAMLAVLAAVFAALAAVQALVLVGDAELARLVALPPVLINGWIAWMFGRTLLEGREPLITRFSRLHRPSVPPELYAYTRRLTRFWTVYMTALTLLSAAIGLNADLKTWSWVVNIGMPGVTVCLFLMEHAYRSVVFRHLGHNSPLDTVRTLMRPETWIAP
jgi:uncharacterized membrane protein